MPKQSLKHRYLTGTATTEQVEALVALAQEPEFSWKEAIEATGVGYSRGWLIVRTAFLEANAPELITPMADMLKAEAAKGKSSDDFVLWFAHRIVVPMRDDHQLSWGEISVRLQIPENRVRKFYRGSSVKKDKGLRIGKGGRFAYDDMALYQGNMQKEGAYIPVEQKMRPKPEQCLNYQPPAKVRKARTRTAK